MTDTTTRIDELEVQLQAEKIKNHKARTRLLAIVRMLENGDRTTTDRMANALVMTEAAIEQLDACWPNMG